MRASSVVHCQSTCFASLLRLFSHAFVSLRSVSMSGIRRHKHCRVSTLSSISAIFNQLPCLGVYTISKREHNLCASSASNALDKDDSVCVFRLSQTKITRFAIGYTSSNSTFTSSAQSTAVRRSRTDHAANQKVPL